MVLSADRTTHGVDDYSIPPQAVDDVQRQVDDAISAAAADKATSIGTDAATDEAQGEPATSEA